MTETVPLAPVTGRSRIDVLDVLRGIAILGIFFMNIPTMATAAAERFGDGWSSADYTAFSFVFVLGEGTQRGLLELLFGAGAMILTARAMAPDGSVAVADLFYRRNLWLLGFGLVDVFGMLWVGDILHIYALAALLLFPFRRLAPRWLIAIGLLFAGYTTASQLPRYLDARQFVAELTTARQHLAAHQSLTAVDRKTLADEKKFHARYRPDRQAIAKEERERGTSPLSYARSIWAKWVAWETLPSLVSNVAEAFCTMLIGMALWKWRVIQGGRMARFYAVMTIVAYGIGLTFRLGDLPAIIAMRQGPKLIWLIEEVARLAVTLGHVGLVNLLLKTAGGRRLLAPFKAAGRTAFSLYFLTSFIGVWVLFAPWGPGLWNHVGWARMVGIAAAVDVLLLLAANIWVRFFANGPLEWLWRSLSYGRRQPFRVRRETALATLPV